MNSWNQLSFSLVLVRSKVYMSANLSMTCSCTFYYGTLMFICTPGYNEINSKDDYRYN